MSWSSSQKKETRFAFQCTIQLTSMSAIMRLITSPTSNIPKILTHFEINTWAVRTQWFCQTQSIYPSKFFPLHWPFYLEKFNEMIRYNLDQNINLGKKRGSRKKRFESLYFSPLPTSARVALKGEIFVMNWQKFWQNVNIQRSRCV